MLLGHKGDTHPYYNSLGVTTRVGHNSVMFSWYKCQLIYVHKRLLKGAQNHASSDAKWSFKRYESPTIVITVA